MKNIKYIIVVSLLVSIAVIFLPIFQFNKVVLPVRIFILFSLLYSAYSINRSKILGVQFAKFTMLLILLWAISTITPDREDSILDGVELFEVNHYVIRFILLAGYSVAMLWGLDKLLNLFKGNHK